MVSRHTPARRSTRSTASGRIGAEKILIAAERAVSTFSHRRFGL
jgi:hypothetical protein